MIQNVPINTVKENPNNPRTASQQNPPTRGYFGWNPVLPNKIYVNLGSVKV